MRMNHVGSPAVQAAALGPALPATVAVMSRAAKPNAGGLRTREGRAVVSASVTASADSDGSECDCRANGRTKCDALSHGTSRGSSPGGTPKRVCGVAHT